MNSQDALNFQNVTLIRNLCPEIICMGNKRLKIIYESYSYAVLKMMLKVVKTLQRRNFSCSSIHAFIKRKYGQAPDV